MKTSTLLLAVIASAVVIGVLNRVDPNGPRRPKAEPTPTPSGPSKGELAVISGPHWYGADSKELFQKLVSFSIAQDGEAFGKLMTAGLVTGKTTAFEHGEEVFVADISYFSGTAKVRRKGDVNEYWTNIESIAKPKPKPWTPNITGRTLAQVEKNHGQALSKDKASGWAIWPKFRARFEGGNVVEVEANTP
jgi:hypothetical protein